MNILVQKKIISTYFHIMSFTIYYFIIFLIILIYVFHTI